MARELRDFIPQAAPSRSWDGSDGDPALSTRAWMRAASQEATRRHGRGEPDGWITGSSSCAPPCADGEQRGGSSSSNAPALAFASPLGNPDVNGHQSPKMLMRNGLQHGMKDLEVSPTPGG